MALPKWITPAGQLGIVPELEYYEFPLDAYDASGGTLNYFLVSGRLPLGIQVVTTGKLQGIPVSELGGDQNVVYTFTIRVKNTTTTSIADRTFTLTITNIAPPIITPRSNSSILNISGDLINANVGNYITQGLTGANLVVLENTTNTRNILVRYVTPIPILMFGSGNLAVNGTSINSFPAKLTPKEYNLGLFFDGTIFEKQLDAIEFLPGAGLTWELKSAPETLPPGLTLSASGLLSGILEPIPSEAPGTHPNWDRTAWSYLGWDFPLHAIGKNFTFSIQVFDGVNYDLATYVLQVLPKGSLTLDNSELTVDTTLITIDITQTKHVPIITTTQADFIPVRQGSYFAFKIEARDIDGDLVNYSVPQLVTGGFDEETFSNVNLSYPYVASKLSSGRLTVGVYPDVSSVTSATTATSISSQDYTQAYLEPGSVIQVLNNSNIWQLGTVTSSVTVRLTGTAIPNISTGLWLTQASSLANAAITSVGDTIGTISLAGNITTGYLTAILPTYQITFNSNIYANVGDYITQTISGANARVTSAVGNATVGSTTANVIYITGGFTNGNIISGSNIKIRGSNVAVYPTANIKDIQNITISANIGDIITQVGSTGNATVTANVSDAARLPVRFNSGLFNVFSGNIKVNGNDANIWLVSQQQTVSAFSTRANIGEYIKQASTSANAVVTANVLNGTTIPVRFISTPFSIGAAGGNLTLAEIGINAYPTNISCSTDVVATYTDSHYFDVNPTLVTSNLQVNGANVTYNTITSIVSVGITLGALATEGTVGFDKDGARFDQGVADLPAGLSLNTQSGWLTGYMPTQTVSQVDYDFEILAYKANDPTYEDAKFFTLTVLGDLNNRIDWITPSDLGTIDTGKVSDLFVYATSSLGKTLYYELATNSYQRLPQGLIVTLNGLISGRVSFEVFSLDQSNITLDGESTTFDFTYTFTVTARDNATTISANRTFTLKIRQFDKIPYENLYLKAQPSRNQRAEFEKIVNDRSIFPLDKIYRKEDPWFGLSKDIRTLFLAGLSPSTLTDYVQAASKNHFKKRLTFGDVKTAQVLDDNFNVKYEVVYLEIFDENSIANGDGPADTQYPKIDNPYYDKDGNAYTIAYPNAFEDMGNAIVSSITYQDKGVLPDWMTSVQPNGRQLGFVYAAVLAYTMPGESALISYRLKERNFNFNTIDFTVDRYQLDNIYTTNYDISANAFVISRETTFDRYPKLNSTLNFATTVDYAVSVSYEDLNDRYVQDIKDAGGMDGIKNFKDGDTLVFAKQEYTAPGSTAADYNQGWSNVIVLWDNVGWAAGSSTDGYDYASTGNITANANLILSAATGTISSSSTFTFEVTGLRVGMTPNVAFAAGTKITSITSYVLVNGNVTTTWSNVTLSSGNITAITSPIRFSAVESDDDVQVPYDANLLPQNPSTITYNDAYIATGYDLTPGQRWDYADYLPGYNEYILGATYAAGASGFPASPTDGILFKYNNNVYHYDQNSSLWRLANQRVAVWQINISDNIVTLSLVRGIDFFNSIYVRNGFNYGGTNIYYDPLVKSGFTIPNYSLIPQQIKTVSTKFDGNGTRFFDHRDSYIVPEQGDKYIKFTKTGVFT